MTGPILPSWHWDPERSILDLSTLTPLGVQQSRRIAGPLAERLWDCLSWIDAQTRLPEPDAEPEGPSSADLRANAQELRRLISQLGTVAEAIEWEADR